MENESFFPSILCNPVQNSEVNLGSLSEMMILGIPVLDSTLFQNNIAVSIAESSLKQGKNMGVLEYLSTITGQALKLAALPSDKEVT